MLLALGYGAWRAHQRAAAPAIPLVLLGVGVALVLVSLGAPAALRPLYRSWMALGHAMGRVTTPVFLGVLFVLVFIPTRAVLALMRRDLLGMRPDRAAPTYWSERPRTTFTHSDFERLS